MANWMGLLRVLPMVKGAVDGLVAPGAYQSKTVWYNLLKAAITLAAALGFYVTLSGEDIETISIALSLGVPAILTVLDAIANIWLRVRTKSSLQELDNQSK